MCLSIVGQALVLVFACGERWSNFKYFTLLAMGLSPISCPFCSPEGGPSMTSENLGEFLTGNRIETSPYSIYMQHNISCSALCKVFWGRSVMHPTENYAQVDVSSRLFIDYLAVERVWICCTRYCCTLCMLSPGRFFGEVLLVGWFSALRHCSGMETPRNGPPKQ